jgi:hypothetical protein
MKDFEISFGVAWEVAVALPQRNSWMLMPYLPALSISLILTIKMVKMVKLIEATKRIKRNVWTMILVLNPVSLLTRK